MGFYRVTLHFLLLFGVSNWLSNNQVFKSQSANIKWICNHGLLFSRALSGAFGE